MKKLVMGNEKSNKSYVVGEKYWKDPAARDKEKKRRLNNTKEDYVNDAHRKLYSRQLIETMLQYFKEEQSFSMHEFGAGWGAMLYSIHEIFPSAQMSMNDIWKDALEYVVNELPFIKSEEMLTQEWVKSRVSKSEPRLDLIITNTHLIHLDKLDITNVLLSAASITNMLILQEDILNLETVWENDARFDLLSKQSDGPNGANYRYTIRINHEKD